MTRVIDNGSQGGACPVCNADKNAIAKPDAVGKPDYYICVVCGYDESQQAKFPSHEE